MKTYTLLLILLVACGSSETQTDTGTPDMGERADMGDDAGLEPEAGTDADAADAGTDAPEPDSGRDTGPDDAGPDVMVDAGDDAPDIGPVPTRHRAERAECDHERPTPDVTEPIGACTSHDMCQDTERGENGRCIPGRGGNFCTYDRCFNDDGCGATSACICEGSSRSDANICMGGDCQIDADCGDNGFCSPSFGGCGAFGGVVAYFCHTPFDECLNDEDCRSAAGDRTDCRFSAEAADAAGEGHWVCGGPECAG